jgi:hypothetical protein
MPRRRQDVDWYCEMSEWLERKERRRKWVWLAVCVAIPLLLMGTFVVAVELHRRQVKWLPEGIRNWFRSTANKTEEPEIVIPQAFPPVTVDGIVEENIKFIQLDANELPTSITFFFREVPIELGEQPGGGARRGFIINRSSETEGSVGTYNLVNTGTGESFEFKNIEAELISEAVGWRITDEGWRHIRDELQGRMRVRLSARITQ